jgi:short-subunit dehydrogenase
LINNAGIFCGGPIEFASRENIENLFQVNFIGQINMIQWFLPLLRQGSGRIINVSSTNGFTAFPFMGIYCATKFAMDGVSNALRIELAPWNIPVSVVYPDKIKSNIWKKALHQSDELFDQLSSHEKELYKENYRKAHQAISEIEKQALPAELIAKTILNILKSKKPKRKYFPGGEAKIFYFLNKYLPGSFIDQLIVKQLKIK